MRVSLFHSGWNHFRGGEQPLNRLIELLLLTLLSQRCQTKSEVLRKPAGLALRRNHTQN